MGAGPVGSDYLLGKFRETTFAVSCYVSALLIGLWSGHVPEVTYKRIEFCLSPMPKNPFPIFKQFVKVVAVVVEGTTSIFYYDVVL